MGRARLGLARGDQSSSAAGPRGGGDQQGQEDESGPGLTSPHRLVQGLGHRCRPMDTPAPGILPVRRPRTDGHLAGVQVRPGPHAALHQAVEGVEGRVQGRAAQVDGQALAHRAVQRGNAQRAQRVGTHGVGLPALEEGEQQAAPVHHACVGRVGDMQVQQVAQGAAGSLGPKRATELAPLQDLAGQVPARRIVV